MKPAPFHYYRPSTIAEAVDALVSTDSAKVLAGGQSLVPAMNFRLALPDLLVDIGGVEGLDRLETGSEGVTIGAGVTQSRVMNAEEVNALVPGLRRTLRWVAHMQIRNRGTVCGSLAHADPAAELPALAIASGATLTIQGPKGTRTVPAESFFLGPFLTDLAHGEIITGIRFPAEASGTVTVMDEISMRVGDFALVGLAAAFRLQESTITAARLVSFGVSGVASRMSRSEEAIRGFEPGRDPSAIRAAAYEDAADAVEDVHANAEYRREALGVLLSRAAGSVVSSNGERRAV